jgi:putative membrane protein
MEKDYRISVHISRYLKIGLFASAIFCFGFSVLVPIFNNGNELRIIAAIGMTVFVMFHGIHRYGWQKMGVFLVITFIISWIFETISISTGFPFGNFYYTELLGAKAGIVPWGIMLAYFFTGYLAWTVGTIFLNESNDGIIKRNLVLLPIVAAAIMVLWNLSFDPVLSIIEGNWVWEGTGGFHGVPVVNFFGWFFTTYLSFQLFAVFLYAFKEKKEEVRQNQWFWFLVPIMLFCQVIEYIIHPFFRTEYMKIYNSAFWVAIFGIGALSLACILVLFIRNKKIAA